MIRNSETVRFGMSLWTPVAKGRRGRWWRAEAGPLGPLAAAWSGLLGARESARSLVLQGVLVGVACLALGVGCDSGSGDDGGGGSTQEAGTLGAGEACSTDNQCASGQCQSAEEFGDLVGALGTGFGEECYGDCLFSCDLDLSECDVACASLCQGDCMPECLQDCESDSDCGEACWLTCIDDIDTTPGEGSLPIPGSGENSDGSEQSTGSSNGMAAPSGFCAPASSAADSEEGGESSSPSNPTSTATEAMKWSGTWSIALDYTAKCNIGFGDVKSGKQAFSVTLDITDNAGSAKAKVDGYELTGPASASKLTLSGAFPIRSDSGHVASNVTKDNNVSIVLDTPISANEASGRVSGQFKGQFGESCTVESGTAVLSR